MGRREGGHMETYGNIMQDAFNSFLQGNCSNSTQPPGVLVDLETIRHTIGQRHGLDALTVEQISLFLRVKGWRFPYLTCKTKPRASTVHPCCWRTRWTDFVLHTVVRVDFWFHWLQPSSRCADGIRTYPRPPKCRDSQLKHGRSTAAQSCIAFNLFKVPLGLRASSWVSWVMSLLSWAAISRVWRLESR